MKKLSKWLHKVSTGWVTLVTLVIFLVFMATVLSRQVEKTEETSGEAKSPDTAFFYSIGELYKMAEDYGDSGRIAYIRTRFSFDLLFPLVYTAFLSTSISWITKRVFSQSSKWQFINLTPVFGMAFDYLENISTSLVMARYPTQTPVVDRLAPIFSLVKWIFVNGSFILLFLGILITIWRWVKGRPTNSAQGTNNER
jgi:hypothetical protein